MLRVALTLLVALAVGLAACNGDGEDKEDALRTVTIFDESKSENVDTDAGATDLTEGATAMQDTSGPPPVATEPSTTESGLQIIDIEVGSGAVAEAGGTVTVHYTGWLADGTTFDSSVERGQPFEFRLGAGEVIQGWDEGVAGMKVGGKRRLIIPPELAYGAGGRGSIPPNAELTFDVELLGVQ